MIKTFFGHAVMFRKESFLWYKLLQLNEYTFEIVIICFNYKIMFSFACCSILRKCYETVEKFSVLGPNLSFL